MRLEFSRMAPTCGRQGRCRVVPGRTRLRVDIGAAEGPQAGHRLHSASRTARRLGVLLAPALLASACAFGAGVSTGPGEPAEESSAVAAVRSAILLDPLLEKREPRDLSVPAGGSEAQVVLRQRP